MKIDVWQQPIDIKVKTSMIGYCCQSKECNEWVTTKSKEVAGFTRFVDGGYEHTFMDGSRKITQGSRNGVLYWSSMEQAQAGANQ